MRSSNAPTICGLIRPAALIGLVVAAAPVWSQAPSGVSPGSPAQAEALAGSCPAFSWSTVADASGYDLVLYRVSESGTLEHVFQQRLPDGASSWTPPAASCPQSGAEYAWAVRALRQDGAGPWSKALLFSTSGTPSDDEVRQALDTLRRRGEATEERVGEGLAPPGADPGPPGSVNTALADSSPPVHATGVALSSASVGDRLSPQAITTPSSFALSLDGDLDLGGAVFQGGIPLLHAEGGLASNSAVGLGALTSVTSGRRNTALGQGALQLTTEGGYNTAGGVNALLANTLGRHNTALGNNALQSSTGSYNAALGSLALTFNGDGSRNTAAGFAALISNTTGYNNVAVGYRALANNTAGTDNVAVGDRALYDNGGSFNTAIGDFAGANWTTGQKNIAIGFGSTGLAAESGVIRIGGNDNQTKTFIEGISGTNVAGVQVLISGDQLGVAASSARFKRDIHDLEGVSDRLGDLRPVSFRYKDEYAGDGGSAVEYGLIAEEVAQVFPELVVRDEDGRPYTVRYHLLTPLLLGEIQRLQDEVARVSTLERELAAMRRELEVHRAGKRRSK